MKNIKDNVYANWSRLTKKEKAEYNKRQELNGCLSVYKDFFLLIK